MSAAIKAGLILTVWCVIAIVLYNRFVVPTAVEETTNETDEVPELDANV